MTPLPKIGNALDFVYAQSLRRSDRFHCCGRIPNGSVRVHWEKTTGLSADETKELEHYLELEHIMRLAKAKARELAQK
jgi:hypothetical protein